MEKMAEEIYDRVVCTLIDKLKASGLTQEELAHRCGLTQPTIQRIMSMKRGQNLPFKTVLQIILALDIDLASLLTPPPKDKHQKIKTLLAEIGKMISNE